MLLARPTTAPVGDVETRRINGHRMFDFIGATSAPIHGVDTDKFTVTAGDGTALSATWYRSSTGEPPGSAVLYLHGGGMIFSLDHLGPMYELAARRYVAESGVSMLKIMPPPTPGPTVPDVTKSTNLPIRHDVAPLPVSHPPCCCR